MKRTLFVEDEAAMMALGENLAGSCQGPAVIYLQGDLGAGKSTFARGFIKGKGYQGHVKSPTYTLVEPYQVTTGTIYHMDLYRLADPEELEFIGIRDMLQNDSICLVEWPEKGKGLLPEADLLLSMASKGDGREVVIQSAPETTCNIFNQL